MAFAAVLGIGIYMGRASHDRAKAANASQPPAFLTSAEPGKPSEPAILQVQAPAGGFDPKYVRSELVKKVHAPQTIPVSGKLVFNVERLHLVSARVVGRLDTILVFEGANVTTGQPLAELYSPDFISAQSEYLLARNTVRIFSDSGSADLLNDARATEESAQNRLRILGASDQDIARLASTGTPSTHLAIRAPINGKIIKRNMDPGAYLNIGDALMSIADTNQLWFVGNIYEQDLAKVRVGQQLQIQAAGFPDQRFGCRVNMIAASIDATTHTLPIRCDISNPKGALRPEMFVTANLKVGQREGFIVPKSSVLRIRDSSYVVVEQPGGKYERRLVPIMNLDDGRVAILSGLKADERVVVEGASLISELFSGKQG